MLPLSGFRVLGWNVGVAGPFGGMVFADLGAELINIERPGERHLGGFLAHERHKKSIAVNAREEEGKEVLRKLIKTADVLWENFAPGALGRLGFSPEEVLKINPKIIYISCKGYGEGPYEMRSAWDPCVQAEAGYAALTGQSATDAHYRIGGPSIDETTASIGVICTIGALLNRAKTGKGEYIRVNMYEDAVSSLGHHVALYTLYGTTLKPIGSGKGATRAYETINWWMYVDASTDENWKKFCEALGVDEENMKKFSTRKAREENPEEVETIMAMVISKMTTSEVVEKLRKAGVPVAPVNTMKEVIDDPHIKATKSMVRLMYEKDLAGNEINPFGKALAQTMLPVRTSDYNPNRDGWGGNRAPYVGENTVELLQELGYTEEQIVDLRKRKVVCPYLEEET